MMSDSEATTPETAKPPTAAPAPKVAKAKKALKKSAKPRAAKAKKALKKSAKPKAAKAKPGVAKAKPRVAKAKPKAAKAKAAKRGLPKPTPALSTRIVNKARFIRSLPSTMPAKEVVARAKELGAVLTESYVYNTRGLQKHGKKAKLQASRSYGNNNTIHVPRGPATFLIGAMGGGGGSNGRVHSDTLHKTSIEGLLQAVASELGLSNAIKFLQATRATVAEAMGTLPPF